MTQEVASGGSGGHIREDPVVQSCPTPGSLVLTKRDFVIRRTGVVVPSHLGKAFSTPWGIVSEVEGGSFSHSEGSILGVDVARG